MRICIDIAFRFCVIYVTMKKETVTNSYTKCNKDIAIFEKIAKSIVTFSNLNKKQSFTRYILT